MRKIRNKTKGLVLLGLFAVMMSLFGILGSAFAASASPVVFGGTLSALGIGLLVLGVVLLVLGFLPWTSAKVRVFVFAFGIIIMVVALTAFYTPATQQINTTTTTTQTYSMTYQLSYFQSGAAGTGTGPITLPTSAQTINGVNGVLVKLPVYTGGGSSSGAAAYTAFVFGADHNATSGNAIFTATFIRTDSNLNSISLSVSATNIPSVTNTTTGKTYTLVAQTSTGSYEVYFNNNTTLANIYVHLVPFGSSVAVEVSMNIPVTAALAMTVYQSVSLDITASFGSGQSLSIPVELIRTS
jgi:hypothetical protein